MIWLIISAIFLIPLASIVTIPGTIVWFPQLLMLELLGAFCFASSFWKLNKFLAIFLCYLAFSYVYVTGASSRTLLCLLIGYTAVSVTLVASEIKNLRNVYIALGVMSIISILYAFLQVFGIDPIFKSTGSKYDGIVSLMGSHNQFGIYSVASSFCFPYLIPLAIVPIFLAKCNSAFIGLFAGSICYAYFRYGRKIAGIVLIAMFILIAPWWHFCNKGYPEIKERLDLWKLSIQQSIEGKVYESNPNGSKRAIQSNPLTGFGLGDFFNFSPMSQYKMYGLNETTQYSEEDPNGKIYHFYEHAHNDLIEALFEFGYIGFIILMFVIGSVVVTFIQCSKTHGVILTFSSLLAQSVCSFSVYVFHAPVSLFMFCLTLGLFYGEINHAKQGEIKPITT